MFRVLCRSAHVFAPSLTHHQSSAAVPPPVDTAFTLDLDYFETKAQSQSTKIDPTPAVAPSQPVAKWKHSPSSQQQQQSKSTTQSPVLPRPAQVLTETPLVLQQDLAQANLIQQALAARAEKERLAKKNGGIVKAMK